MKILLASLQLILTIHQVWSACRKEDHYGVYFTFCDDIKAFEDIPKELYGSRKFYMFINNSTLSLAETVPLHGLSKLVITSSTVKIIKSSFLENADTLSALEIINSTVEEIEALPQHSLYDFKILKSTVKNVPIDLLHKISLKVFSVENSNLPNLQNLPNYFFNNSRLVYLSLKNLNISIFEPYSFRTMQTLQVLNLAENVVNELPSNIFEDLKELQDLNLESNHIKKFEENSFFGLQSLKTLQLSNNRLSRIERRWFDKLNHLNTLDLGHNKITDFDLHMKNLTSLNLAYNNLETISDNAFEGVPTVLELDLSHNGMELILPHAFKGLSKLKDLNLGFNKINILDNGLLRLLPDLQKLVVRNNEFTSFASIEIDSLKNLKYLDASFNDLLKLKGDFKKVPLLQHLDLTNTSLQHVDAGMFKDLKKLELLNISDNNLKTLTPEVFTHLTNLNVLVLKNVGLSKLEIGTFSNLKNLTILDLEGNELNELPVSIFNDSHLEELSVKGNPISEISEDIYKYQSKLNTINLEYTPIVSVNETDVIPNLRYLLLTGTVFEKRIVFRTKTKRFEKINDRVWDSWCPDYFLPCQKDTPMFSS